MKAKERIVKSVTFLIVSLTICLPVFGKNLCEYDDKIVFSCEVEAKNISVCLTSTGSVKYLFGTRDNIERQLSSPIFSSAACSGGAVSRVRFKTGNTSYVVYDVMCNSYRINDTLWSKSESAGVMVLNGDKVQVKTVCTDFDDSLFGINTALLPGSIEKEDFDHELP